MVAATVAGAFRTRGVDIAISESMSAKIRILLSPGHARVSTPLKIPAQFCANQLVRRAIGDASEKYFRGAAAARIGVEYSRRTSPASRRALHCAQLPARQDCIKSGYFFTIDGIAPCIACADCSIAARGRCAAMVSAPGPGAKKILPGC